MNFGRLLQIEQEIQQDVKLGAFQSSNEFENKMRQEVSSIVDDETNRIRDAKVLELITIVNGIASVLSFDLQHVENNE